MATERRLQEASEILDVLHSLSLDTEEEILAMPRDQVRARLQEEGIDPDAGKSAMKLRFQEIRGRQKLEAARRQRQAHEASIARRQLPVAGLSADEMRAEAFRRLNQLTSTGSVSTHIYFNRFQNATDSDLPGLLEDLQLLEEMDQGSGTDDG